MIAHWILMMLHSLAYATVSGAILIILISWALWTKKIPLRRSLCLAFILSVFILSAFFTLAALRIPTQSTPRTTSSSIRIAHLNALFYTTNGFPEKLAFAKTSDADVISLVEVPEKLGQLLIAQSGYPHYHFTQHASTGKNLPMLTLSRWPLKIAHHWSSRAIAFTVQHPQHPFVFIQIHPQSPYSLSKYQKRNTELAALSSPTFTMPTILVGDLNTTPWDQAINPLAQNLTFRGLWLPTFPSFMPITPIDLIFSTPAWQSQTPQRIRIKGTDHLGIITDFPRPPSKTTQPNSPTI